MRIALFTAIPLFLISCGGRNTDSNVNAPGAEKTGETRMLETGADILQRKSPLKKINAYLKPRWSGFAIPFQNLSYSGLI